MSMKLDSGADITVQSEQFYKSEFHMWPIVPTNKVLIGPCKTKILCVGKMNATIKTKSGNFTEEVFNVPDLEKPLLKPGFYYTDNTTTTAQKQSDYRVEQSSLTLIALF